MMRPGGAYGLIQIAETKLCLQNNSPRLLYSSFLTHNVCKFRAFPCLCSVMVIPITTTGCSWDTFGPIVNQHGPNPSSLYSIYGLSTQLNNIIQMERNKIWNSYSITLRLKNTPHNFFGCEESYLRSDGIGARSL